MPKPAPGRAGPAGRDGRPRRAGFLTFAVIAAATLIGIAGCTHVTAFGSGAGGDGTSGAGASGRNGSAPGASSAPHWHLCSPGAAQLRCGQIQVPLNYSDPGGRKITLALSEVPAAVPPGQQKGILLVNPGGPGGSGTSLAGFVAQQLDPRVAAEYTIIGFDPRGVGASVPALHCDRSFFSKARPNYIPASPAAEKVLENRAKQYASDCGRRFGWLLPYMTTVNVARDMDKIRAAMGQRKLSYLGYSYGTYIGQVYATLFPQRVRHLVLDSTVDPTGVWYNDNIAQDYAFQGRQTAFLAWMAKYDTAYHMGRTVAAVRRSWYQARNKLAQHPIPGPSGTPLIGADEYDDTMLVGGYDDSYWPGLAAAMSSYLQTGATSQMISMYNEIGKQDENEFAVYNAVECADVAWPRTWSKWDADARKVYATAPVEAWDNLWFNAACAFWPVHGPAAALKIGARGLPGILMLQGTLDGATPYQGAQDAHRLLPTARMVVVQGGGNHGQSLAVPPDACVNGYLNRYLATGALPSAPGLINATCPALPAPTPSG
ncbi:MAG TPA: alpha/beta hydrolase [Streptosporangiaceae bacterium]|nr:alpha/beta hydrolase [Streptosporangiaceae bacterium]